jgi:hypothetical protein
VFFVQPGIARNSAAVNTTTNVGIFRYIILRC